jgi:hypothetical protein
MKVRSLTMTLGVVLAVAATGYGAFAVLAESSPASAAAGLPRVAGPLLDASLRIPDAERIESPRECRHETGVHQACTYM